jgi:hypothetical protein
MRPRASTRSALARTCLAAAALASTAAFGQPELAATDPEGELVRQIAQLRAAGGPAPATVIEPLSALALIFEESGDHTKAIVALEDARAVTRIHNGLSSSHEALLLRQQIRSEKALGQHQRAWDLEQEMVTIARQHLGDLRMVPVFRELAEDREDVLAKYGAGQVPPEVYIGCYYAAAPLRYDDTRGTRRPEGASCRSGSTEVVVGQLRAEVLIYYADAIEIILNNRDYASQELRELEKQVLRFASFPRLAASRCTGTLDELIALELLGPCLRPVIHADGVVTPNVGGSVSLIRLIAYEFRSEAPPTARARAIAELADWHLLRAHSERRSFDEIDATALALYERARWELEQGAGAQVSTPLEPEPELPVTLPTFEANPFVLAAPAETSRYIDVRFVVTKYGRSDRIEILDTSRNTTRAEERELIRLIESSSFRPRFVDGELADAAPVVVRYRLGT